MTQDNLSRDLANISLESNDGSSINEQEREAMAERQLTILFGTQTGTAEDVANRIGKEARRRRFQVTVRGMDEYDKASLISESLVIFVISTTGQGTFPTRAMPFWKFLLREGLPKDILCDLTFATFGLGDTNYARFCWPARKLNRRLKDLGAEELIQAGEGDDQHYLGIDGTLQPWMETLWSTLDELLPLPTNVERIPDSVPLPPEIRIELSRDSNKSSVGGNQEGKGVDTDFFPGSEPTDLLPPGYRWGRLRRNERMTSEDHWQDVRHIEIESEDGSNLDYRAGDVACLMPENDSDEVSRLIERLGWGDRADDEVRMVPIDPSRPLPFFSIQPCLTIRKLLTRYLDPFSVPRRSFFDSIRNFSPPDHMEREKLDEYCQTAEGAEEMYDYAQRVRRTMAEVLYEFKSVQIPIEYILEVFPTLRERQFSIASGPSRRPTSVELAVAIVKYKTRLKKPRRGICTSWLSTLRPGTKLGLRIERGTMRAPSSNSTPMILVGPGTGVAPMRSFVQERILQETPPSSDRLLLYLGCRYSTKDFLFRTEWQELHEKRLLTYRLAPSRETESKIYVQDRIREDSERVWDLVGRRGGYVLISGSSGKMPESVREAVKYACVKHGDLDQDQAERYMEAMEKTGRWQEECWD
ncbi:riboflavin synthase domain-like protein [Violaceomyces palustris]|uniref:Riboflavin synthase domain-like protein n=1 Tax=Violaceomyces palustris TaxID=1673888 RepID=A0ACD0NRH9_9BASI|nr:riboflavin synthase domain-like protein [Violaceomyces palustris]